MQDILSRIVADKRVEIAESKMLIPTEILRGKALASPRSTRSMRAALAASSSGIIAEFKRKSPSKGWIHENALPEDVVPAYAAAGASAVSILTDSAYFGGSLEFIRRMRPLVDIPILRKDFIVDVYQLLEAREAGADAVLLIAACLTQEECAGLIREAHGLGLEVLLELHSPSEIAYAGLGADMLGINNRNLGTFHTDVRNSFSMAEALRGSGVDVLVSESGISSVETVRALRKEGFRGFLMGENFMKTADPAATLSGFIEAL